MNHIETRLRNVTATQPYEVLVHVCPDDGTGRQGKHRAERDLSTNITRFTHEPNVASPLGDFDVFGAEYCVWCGTRLALLATTGS